MWLVFTLRLTNFKTKIFNNKVIKIYKILIGVATQFLKVERLMNAQA